MVIKYINRFNKVIDDWRLKIVGTMAFKGIKKSTQGKIEARCELGTSKETSALVIMTEFKEAIESWYWLRYISLQSVVYLSPWFSLYF